MARAKLASAVIMALVLSSVPLIVPQAVAAVGDLTPAGCIDDNDSGADTCAQSVDGLDRAIGIVVTEDGKSVYATGEGDDNALVRFDRDPQTGALTFVGCIDDNDTGSDTCAQGATGLDDARHVTVSPDGKSLYVAGRETNTLVRFDRDPQTGALTSAGCIDDNDVGPDTCAQSVDGLDGARSVAVSADGRSVYVASFDDDALVRFDRDPQTGALTSAGCIDDNDTGSDTCAQSADGLDGAHLVTLSADGRSVYVAGEDDDALVRFDRDPQTGALTDAGCIDDNDTGPDTCGQSADGLDHAAGVSVSADGTSLYVAANVDNALVRFDRNPQTGALTPAGCIDDNDTGPDTCVQSVDGLDGVEFVAVSGDGRSLYVASLLDDALVRFDRDPDTGALTSAGCIDDNDTGADTCVESADGLDGARAIAVSADGASVYVASQDDDALVRFGRETDSGDTDPPETTVTGPRKTTNRRPMFRLGSDEPGSTFSCKLDKRPFTACSSPYRTPKLAFGKHVLQVVATDSAGNPDATPAKKSFTVQRKT